MLEPDIRALLEARLGTPLQLRMVRARPHRVVDVRGPRGRVWCKQLGNGRAFRQTITAHEAWAETLADGLAPVLDVLDSHRCLLLGHVEGTPATGDDPAVHEAAGTWLRRAHATAVSAWGDNDPMPLEEAMARRARGWIEGARELLSRGEWEAAAGELRDLRAFAGEGRVPCHRDFGPHNWLLRPAGGLVVLDLEHARPDHWLADLAKLAADHWSRRPDLERAFSRGYGRPLDPMDRRRLRPWIVGHALVMVGWGTRHDDADLSTKGRRLLQEVLDGALEAVVFGS